MANKGKVLSANHPTAASHTHQSPGRSVCVCVFACRHVCMCLDTIKMSSWRRVPMHHPDDSGQAVCFAAADIELNDVVLHCSCRGWPAHHWCVAAGFQLGGGVCVCVFRQIEPLVWCREARTPSGIFVMEQLQTDHGVFDRKSCRRWWCQTDQPMRACFTHRKGCGLVCDIKVSFMWKVAVSLR